MKNWRTHARCLSARRALFALLACACAFSSAAPASAQNEMRVRFSLDRAIDGTAGPLFLAIDKGYFKQEGLEVAVDPAQSPMEAITRLALSNGATETTHDMSSGDINAMIRYRDQNPATGIEAVFILHEKPTYALIGRKSRGVQFLKDTEGRKLAAPAVDPTSQMWPLFAKLNAIDISKVTVLNVGLQVRVPMLVSGEVDALLGHSFSAAIDLRDRGVAPDDLVVLLMADYGLTVYGAALMASAKFQAEQPEAIRAFLRAYVRGLRDAAQKPEDAVEAALKRMQGASKSVELDRLKIVLSQNFTKIDPKAAVVGAIDPVRFSGALEQLAQISAFKSKLKPEEYFDAAYLPAPPKPELPAKQQTPQKKKK